MKEGTTWTARLSTSLKFYAAVPPDLAGGCFHCRGERNGIISIYVERKCGISRFYLVEDPIKRLSLAKLSRFSWEVKKWNIPSAVGNLDLKFIRELSRRTKVFNAVELFRIHSQTSCEQSARMQPWFDVSRIMHTKSLSCREIRTREMLRDLKA